MATRSAGLEPLPRTVEAFREWAWTRPEHERWEFLGGEAVMMAPERAQHVRLKSRIARALGNQLEGGCEAFVDGLEVVVADMVAIPDVLVTCEQLDRDTTEAKEPVIIVEVLSPGYERHDMIDKWMRYQRIPTLRHYLVVAQSERLVVLHSRIAPDEWRQTFVREGTSELEALGVTLSLDEIYAGSDLESGAALAPPGEAEGGQ